MIPTTSSHRNHIQMNQSLENGFDDLEELEVLFIAETFHKSEPIRAKPEQSVITRVWIKEKVKKQNLNGVVVKLEPKPRPTTNNVFQKMVDLRKQSGIVFESDLMDDENCMDNDDEEYEDIETTIEENILSSSRLKKSTKRNAAINLAKKLKKKAIANRLGVAYNPMNPNRQKTMRSKLGTTKSWSEKFGKLLAAKKLLYLPLLFRKYKMGPKRTREELDIEIDLYMADVRKAKLRKNDETKLKLGLEQIIAAVEAKENVNGVEVVDSKELFGGFGGPGWRKRLGLVSDSTDVSVDKADISVKKEVPDRDVLDMELDEYMANKEKALSNGY